MRKASSSIYKTQTLHCVALACRFSVKDGFISPAFIDAFNYPCKYRGLLGLNHGHNRQSTVDAICGIRGAMFYTLKRTEINGSNKHRKDDEREKMREQLSIKSPHKSNQESSFCTNSESLPL